MEKKIKFDIKSGRLNLTIKEHLGIKATLILLSEKTSSGGEIPFLLGVTFVGSINSITMDMRKYPSNR